jgi:2',3'-cyclic-nucleotide 2'-phosphodiesterase (5'-nucleotidase family)
LARRASFLQETRLDDRANLTVDFGNFAERQSARDAAQKNETLARNYQAAKYDANGIARRELEMGVDSLIRFSHREDLPIVCANLCDRKNGKPVFPPYLLKKDHGVTFGVVGLLSDKAATSLGEDTLRYEIRSPYDYAKKWIKKAARKSDHLTVMGDFGKDEIDSLLNTYPQIDVLLTSASPQGDRPVEHGKTLVIGAQQKGYSGNYIDWTLAAPDTMATFVARNEALDGRFPDDSLVVSILKSLDNRR